VDCDVAVLDGDWKGFRAHLRIDQRLTGFDIELPAMPTTTHEFTFASVNEFIPIGRERRPANRSFAQRPASVRAAIVHRKKLIINVEDSYTGSAKIENEPLAGLQIFSFTRDKGFFLTRSHCLHSQKLILETTASYH